MITELNTKIKIDYTSPVQPKLISYGKEKTPQHYLVCQNIFKGIDHVFFVFF